jgi:peptidyl-prolyl cis-trans isomerase B (cyclophilin B)
MKRATFLKSIVASLALASPAGLAAEQAGDANPSEKENTEVSNIRIKIETSKGEIEAEVYADKAPVTAASFLNLIHRGFYDGLTFHRVVPGFVIQGGDPDGNGSGGPGYRYELEVRQDLKHDAIGVLSTARTNDPNSNGCQFFITLDATPHLDMQYSVWGRTTKGNDVVSAIAVGDKIEKITILDQEAADAHFVAMKDRIAEWNKALEAKGF